MIKRPLVLVLERLEEHGCNPRRSGSSYSARCPSHEDRVASLSASESASGEALLHCHAGCETPRIVSDLGLKMSDLFPADSKDVRSKKSGIIATYDYRDEVDAALFQVVRTSPKGFRQRRPDGNGGWIWNLQNIRRVPYNLSGLIEAIKSETPVFVVEGEKDCERLAREGLTATCCAGGAGKWRPEYAPFFKGALVTVVPDADDPGRAHATQIATSLQPIAGQVKVIDLFPDRNDGADISDFFDAGGTVGQLATLMSAPPPHPVQVTWAHQVQPEKVTWLWQGRVPFSVLTVLTGRPKEGKSTILYDLAARVSREGRRVLIATGEDHLAKVVRPRLEAAGADLKRVGFITGVEGRGLVLPDDGSLLAERVEQLDVALLTIDPLVTFLASNVDSHKDASIRQAMRPLGEIAEKTGAAVVTVVHTNKVISDDWSLRVTGSIGIVAAARQVLLAATHPEDDQRRVLAVSASNLAEEAPALEYRLVGRVLGSGIETSGIEWGEEIDIDTRSLLASDDKKTALSEAIEFLKSSGAQTSVQPAGDLQKEAEQLGITKVTLHRARTYLGVASWKEGKAWFWGPEGFRLTTRNLEILKSSVLPAEMQGPRDQDFKISNAETGNLEASSASVSTVSRPGKTASQSPTVDTGKVLETSVHRVQDDNLISPDPSPTPTPSDDQALAKVTTEGANQTLGTLASSDLPAETGTDSPQGDKGTVLENAVHSVQDDNPSLSGGDKTPDSTSAPFLLPPPTLSDDQALANVMTAFPGSEAAAQ